MKTLRRIVALAVLLGPCATVGADDFDLTWNSIDCGGGSSADGEFELDGTIGQADAGAMSGGEFELTGGFWAGSAEPACAADIDGSGAVDFGDLLAILGAWGECPGCPEDLDGDGFVSFADILVVLGAWGPCP